MTQDSPDTNLTEDIPQAPRAVTPAAARRAWMEPRVRVWWLVAGMLGLITVAVGAREYLAWHRQSALVGGGQRIEATVWQEMDWSAGAPIPNRRIAPNVEAVLVWNLQGKEHTGKATFSDTVVSGTTVPVWVDPADPDRWTVKGEVSPLSHQMIVAGLLLPVALLAALVAWLMRRGILDAWINGQARKAVVVDSHRSALSPRSRQIRCTLIDSGDRRLITVTIPRTRRIPVKGEYVLLLTPPDRTQPAVAARSFT